MEIRGGYEGTIPPPFCRPRYGFLYVIEFGDEFLLRGDPVMTGVGNSLKFEIGIVFESNFGSKSESINGFV